MVDGARDERTAQEKYDAAYGPDQDQTIRVNLGELSELIAELERLRSHTAELQERCSELETSRREAAEVTVEVLCRRAHATAVSKGWYEGRERSRLEAMALVHSEVSEAVEAVRCGALDEYASRSGKPCGYPSELADICIRVFDHAAATGVDLQGAIRRKMAFNATREHRHGGKLA